MTAPAHPAHRPNPLRAAVAREQLAARACAVLEAAAPGPTTLTHCKRYNCPARGVCAAGGNDPLLPGSVLRVKTPFTRSYPQQQQIISAGNSNSWSDGSSLFAQVLPVSTFSEMETAAASTSAPFVHPLFA